MLAYHKWRADLNKGLLWTHGILSAFYALLFFSQVILLVNAVNTGGNIRVEIVFGFLLFGAIMVLHLFAALGAKNGKPWGRTLSKVIGALLLIGFPIGTILGAYILSKTGRKWRDADAPEYNPWAA